MFPFSQICIPKATYYNLCLAHLHSHVEFDLGKDLNTLKDIYVQQIN